MKSESIVYEIDGVVIDEDYIFSIHPRLKGNPYRRAKQYLLQRDQRDGKLYCEIGGEEIRGDFEIHHRGPKNLHVAKFLGIACRAHNAGGHDSVVLGTGSAIPPCVSVSVKERVPLPSRRDGYSAVKNAEAEPFFRRWVFEYLLKHRQDPPTTEFLVENGAALVGANVITVERWLRKMTAKLYGCLDDEVENQAGQKVVNLREAGDYQLTAEQLSQKYPWAGMRFTTTSSNTKQKEMEMRHGPS